MNQSIRIIVADDHALFRSGIISLLDDAREIFVVGQVEDGQELVNKYFELKPDVLLSDISMPVISGTEAVKRIKETDPNVKALFLSMHEGEEYIYHCLKAGALGLISKNILRGELVYAIRAVFNGNKYFGANWTEERLEELIRKYDSSEADESFNSSGLSEREIEILKLIGQGFTSTEIAEKTTLSKRTIDTHRVHLMQKLNVKNLPELIKYAIQFTLKNRDL
ncbi:MAG: response regulator transcription factor [Clostridiales bacterium]